MMFYDIHKVKHDGHHKARFVAHRHLTQLAIESVYSGVVSIHSICLILLITEINNLQIYQADVGNLYLETYTKENVFFIAGKEFDTFSMEGHVLIISKAYPAKLIQTYG